jgi:hypothetical protein
MLRLGPARNSNHMSGVLNELGMERVLARAFPTCFVQQLAQPNASLVKLGFRIPDGTTQQRGNLVVFVSLDVMENESLLIAGRQLCDGALEVHPID